MSDQAVLQKAMSGALQIVDSNLEKFTHVFPDDTSRGNVYYPRRAFSAYPEGGNFGWTTSFWTGMLWLAYEYTGDEKYRRVAEIHVENFAERIERGIDVDHHDLGFLYSVTCIAAHKLTGSALGKAAALKAASTLMNRFWDKPGVIQAWGSMQDSAQKGRVIVDSLMNMPLLYWAAQVSGESRFYEAAHRHAAQLMTYVVRPDHTTYHTFYFDTETGAPRYGQTAQGFSDNSCWARGQAWAIYGFPLNYIYTKDAALLNTAVDLSSFFLSKVPGDGVVYWDLEFGDGSAEEKDSSASAIAACGMLELAKWLPAAQPYQQAAEAALLALARGYAGNQVPGSNAVLLHGVYSKPARHGVDEANLWGDYFYMEGLMRLLRPNWKLYW